MSFAFAWLDFPQTHAHTHPTTHTNTTCTPIRLLGHAFGCWWLAARLLLHERAGLSANFGCMEGACLQASQQHDSASMGSNVGESLFLFFARFAFVLQRCVQHVLICSCRGLLIEPEITVLIHFGVPVQGGVEDSWSSLCRWMAACLLLGLVSRTLEWSKMRSRPLVTRGGKQSRLQAARNVAFIRACGKHVSHVSAGTRDGRRVAGHVSANMPRGGG